MNSPTLRQRILAGIASGRPQVGPSNVHIDVSNGCNAACVSCWDHSPLRTRPRPAAWKRKRLSWSRFRELVVDLTTLDSVRAVVLSGMGEPLTHPDIYRMVALIKAQGWHLTVLSNLVAADPDRLADSGIDSLLVGVHGVSPQTYCAFHPGWTEQQFFTMCRNMRVARRAGMRVRHVQVINRDTAPELVAMVRFGKLFDADRVNYKLASLAEGTQACAITDAQRDQMLERDLPAARALAQTLGVETNLDLFDAQLRAASENVLRTTPMAEVGCYMGHVYIRITVDGALLYCCNTAIEVGHLADGPLGQHWWGATWQATRDRIAAGHFFPGCERCGKFEQNRKWAARVAAHRARTTS
ncbi:MAG: radical SAM protein [Oligoflexia bacterium]|nr:radical SAM protein [Oligoflexia bacterium]